MKRRDFSKAMVVTAGGLIVPVHVGAQVGLFVQGTAAAATAHDHFDAQTLDANKHASWHLRTTGQIESLSSNGSSAPWTYDATKDAALLTFPDGSTLSADSADQLWMDFTLVDTNDSILSFQFDVMYGAEWAVASNNPGWEGSHKAFRLDNVGGGGGDDRMIEHQTMFRGAAGNDVTDNDGVANIPRVHTYSMTVSETNFEIQNPIRLLVSGDRDEQPGGATGGWQSKQTFSKSDHLGGDYGDGKLKPFLQLTEVWCRYTYIWDFSGGSGATTLKVLASDENNGESTIFESVQTSGSGMKVERSTYSQSGGSRLRAEFDSSTASTGAVGAHKIWVRNVLIFKDKAIPHGGSPIAS